MMTMIIIKLGADFECRRHANRANLKGSFKAFLSSSLENLNELVRRETDKRLPVVNLHVSFSYFINQ